MKTSYCYSKNVCLKKKLMNSLCVALKINFSLRKIKAKRIDVLSLYSVCARDVPVIFENEAAAMLEE